MPAENHQLTSETCVILLHGLGRTRGSLQKIARTLESEGYLIWNESYPSREKSVDELARIAIEPALAFCRERGVQSIHFVTHSLGGILVRYYLQEHNIPELGRIVMLSPPNKGSEIVDGLKNLRLFQLITGPVGQQLGTDNHSLPNQLKPIEAEVGVIIGDVSSDPWFSWLMPGKNDGKVSVERARLDEMKDFLVVHHGHTFIMQQEAVIKQIQAFLHQGQFNHAPQ